MITDQVGDLMTAANGPGAMPSPGQAQMENAINTSLGRQSGPDGPPVSIRRGGSWEGFRKTAPAHIGGLQSGYANPSYHKSRSKSLIKASSKKAASYSLPHILEINNMTTSAMREGGTAAELLSRATKLSRLF